MTLSPAPAERQVRLEPSGRTFTVNPGETILEAAIRQGVGLPYGCRNGACGACKGTLQERLARLRRAPGPRHHAGRDRRRQGAHLLHEAAVTTSCCEIRELAGLKDLTIRTLPARVEKIEKPAEDVAILYLKLPASERLQFLAGQYIDILMKDGMRRSYSMANAPHDDTHLQLHVRQHARRRLLEVRVRGDEGARHPALRGAAGHASTCARIPTSR